MSETSASPGVSGASSVVQDAAASHSSLPSWPLIGRNPVKPYLMFLVLKSLEEYHRQGDVPADQEDPAEKFELLLQLGEAHYCSC